MKFNQETKAAIGGETGMVKLASGTITDPVAYIDLALPSGYLVFELRFEDIRLSTVDIIAGAVSYDGGATFLNDTSNFDTYSAAFILNAFSGNVIAGSVDALLYLIGDQIHSDHGIAARGIISIFPGSPDRLASLRAQSEAENPLNDYAVTDTSNLLNPFATVPPTPGRINLLRALPYGNGDANPPTSGVTITAGSYILWGITP